MSYIFSQNDNLLSDMKSTMCAHQEGKKGSFLEKFAHVLYEWSLWCFTSLPKVQLKTKVNENLQILKMHRNLLLMITVLTKSCLVKYNRPQTSLTKNDKAFFNICISGFSFNLWITILINQENDNNYLYCINGSCYLRDHTQLSLRIWSEFK